MTDLVSEEQLPASPAKVSPGRKLAQAREAQDMSVADVAHSLRLGVKQIEALEANDHDKLPGRTFVRGFVRNYARLVNLDPDGMVAEYFPSQQDTETLEIQAPSQRIPFSDHHGRPWLKWLASGFVVVALISWGILYWLGPESPKPVVTVKPATPMPTLAVSPEERPSPAVAVMPESAVPSEKKLEPLPPPVQNTAPLAAGVPVAAHASNEGLLAPVLLSFTGMAWVEVVDKNGKKLHSQNNMAGTQQTVEGVPPLSLVIGSAPNVKLTYKGKTVDLAAYTKADVARLTLE